MLNFGIRFEHGRQKRIIETLLVSIQCLVTLVELTHLDTVGLGLSDSRGKEHSFFSKDKNFPTPSLLKFHVSYAFHYENLHLDTRLSSINCVHFVVFYYFIICNL